MGAEKKPYEIGLSFVYPLPYPETMGVDRPDRTDGIMWPSGGVSACRSPPSSETVSKSTRRPSCGKLHENGTDAIQRETHRGKTHQNVRWFY